MRLELRAKGKRGSWLSAVTSVASTTRNITPTSFDANIDGQSWRRRGPRRREQRVAPKFLSVACGTANKVTRDLTFVAVYFSVNNRKPPSADDFRPRRVESNISRAQLKA